MENPKGKLIAVGGAEDKGTDLERGQISRNNLNFFELGILRPHCRGGRRTRGTNRDRYNRFDHSQ
jgi:hypothetical protein